MTSEEFLSAFGGIAEAPGGIPIIRRLILDLAVRGRLVPQDPADEPALILLERVAEERERLIAEKQLRKEARLEVVQADEWPFPLPEGWEWSRIGSQIALNMRGSSTPASLEDDTWVLDLEDVEKQSGAIIERTTSAQRKTTSSKANFAVGDVLYGKLRPYLNKVVVADADGCCTSEMLVLTPVGGVVPEFLAIWLRCPTFVDWATRATHGVKMPRLSSALLRKRVLPVPPRDEQRRIVARVAELMALCDELEDGQTKAEELRAAVARSALDTIVKSDPADTDPALELVNDHVRLALQPGTGASDVIAELRNAILDLAIRGRLVPQDPADGHASALVNVPDRDGAQPSEDPSIGGYAPPMGWTWCRVADLGHHRLGKMLDKAKQTGELRPYLRGANVQWGRIDLSDVKSMKMENHELADVRLRPGDLLVCEGGEPGRAAIWQGPEEMYFQKALHRIRCRDGIDVRFIWATFRAAANDGRIGRLTTGTTIRHLPGEKLALLEIALPPSGEQVRIMERVDDLMKLCDELEASLLLERKFAGDFAASAINSLIANTT